MFFRQSSFIRSFKLGNSSSKAKLKSQNPLTKKDTKKGSDPLKPLGVVPPASGEQNLYIYTSQNHGILLRWK